MQNALVKLNEACRALSEAKSVDEVKEIRDKAEAIRHFLAKQNGSQEAMLDAAEIKVRAERRLGELLKETVKAGKPKLSPEGIIRKLPEGVSANQSSKWQKVNSVPKPTFEKHVALGRKKGELTTQTFVRLAKEEKKETKKRNTEEQCAVELARGLDERLTLIHSDLATAPVADGSLDWIITDPPYPKEFLPVYDSLGSFAARTLKPGGSLICMIGQSYLPDIVASLGTNLTYHWTLAYLTPGGQAAQMWDRKVNTFWKPLLWYVKDAYEGDWIGDVCKSDTNDNDKQHHHWGQSESGMADVISRLTKPGEHICDPFCGGGTTGVVALTLGRLFTGIDIDADAIETTKERISRIDL